MEYKQFQKEERRELRIAYWQLTTQLSFYKQQEFSEHHKLGFHHILCNNPRGGGTLYGGGGSIGWGLGILLGKDILGFFKNIDMDNS